MFSSHHVFKKSIGGLAVTSLMTAWITAYYYRPNVNHDYSTKDVKFQDVQRIDDNR